MRLGLVTDIHNHAVELACALALFRERGVEQVVTIGDTCDPFTCGGDPGEVAAQLAECNAIGVWGNHDFTLCWNVPDRARNSTPAAILDVMARMKPRLTIGECHFSHRESSVDPYDIEQLWDFSEPRPEMMDLARLAFGAVSSRWQFVGHYHRWWATTPAGPLNWSGDEALLFEPNLRYFIVVAAVCDGWCAVLDTEQKVLEPLRCRSGE